MTHKKLIGSLVSFLILSSASLPALAQEESDQAEENTEAVQDQETDGQEDQEDQAGSKNEEDGGEEAGDDQDQEVELDGPLRINEDPILAIPKNFPPELSYGPDEVVAYPEDGVKGIYVTGPTTAEASFQNLIDMVNSTDLNSMVIDVKEDYGQVVLDFDSDSQAIQNASNPFSDAEELVETLKENDIYPIARIVVFKDTVLAEERPDLSFTQADGTLWKNGRGEAFVNPYEQEVWDYNIEIAKAAAEVGFRDIQFDYVRFPEGFENRDEELQYSRGKYDDSTTNSEQRIDTVKSFVEHARNELIPYNVDVSVDIFGYAAAIQEAPGIGQSFQGISEHVDTISAMIYPSHWGPGNFGIEKPDLEPYNTIDEYMKLENALLGELGSDAPQSRPWIQDFTASYLGAGNYKEYGAQEVTDQVKALHDNGVDEFLLWDASNNYSQGATYSFEGQAENESQAE